MTNGGDNLRISKKKPTNLVKMAPRAWLNVEDIN